MHSIFLYRNYTDEKYLGINFTVLTWIWQNARTQRIPCTASFEMMQLLQ